MAIDIEKLTIKTAREKLLAGEFSATDLAKASLEAIKKSDKDVHAYLEIFDDVLEQAKKADEMYEKKDPNVKISSNVPHAQWTPLGNKLYKQFQKKYSDEVLI